LGEVLLDEKKYAEAEPLLLHSYEGLKQSQAANSPRTRTALLQLVTLYENWGRPDAANEYRKIIGVSVEIKQAADSRGWTLSMTRSWSGPSITVNPCLSAAAVSQSWRFWFYRVGEIEKLKQ
jgi:hypothetical protein